METINSLQGALRGILNDLTQAFAAYVPNLILALLLCLIGWILATLLSKLIIRFGHGIDRLSAVLRKHAQVQAKPLRRPVSHTVANIFYWLVILLFVAAALEPLGLPGLSVWIHHLIGFLPEIFFAGLILLAGYVLGGAVYEKVTASLQLRGSESSAAIGTIAQGVVIGFALILALSQLNLDVSLLVNIFTIIVAASIGGVGLAFGIGASHQVTNILAAHQLNKMYRIGQTVRISGIEGDILELTTTAVVLDTEQGRVVVPAKRFSEEVSILIRKEESNG